MNPPSCTSWLNKVEMLCVEYGNISSLMVMNYSCSIQRACKTALEALHFLRLPYSTFIKSCVTMLICSSQERRGEYFLLLLRTLSSPSERLLIWRNLPQVPKLLTLESTNVWIINLIETKILHSNHTKEKRRATLSSAYSHIE